MCRKGIRLPNLFRAAAALTACVALAGCSASAPTPIVIVVTPAPTLTPIIVYVTPAPTPQATAAPTAAPTASPTAYPEATAAPTSPAAKCSGNDTNKAFFAEAAANLSFGVYCAVLPSSWWIQGGAWKGTDGGLLTVLYQNSAGATVYLREGSICPSWCAAAGSFLGPAVFGDLMLIGKLYTVGGNYILVVGPPGHPTHIMSSSDVSQSQFVAWAAALRKVPEH